MAPVQIAQTALTVGNTRLPPENLQNKRCVLEKEPDIANSIPSVSKVEDRSEAKDQDLASGQAVPPAGSQPATSTSVWKDFYQRDVRKAIGRKRPLLNAASFNEYEAVAVGVFSIPKRRRRKFRAVTEVHYHNACNELARFLIGQLAFCNHPAVSKYMTYADFERDKYKFHKAKIENLKFEKLIGPCESFAIAMEIQRVKKANGRFYAQFSVSNAVSGTLLYSYNPNEPF